MPLDHDDINTIRLIYVYFRAGARLKREDIASLLRAGGHDLSKNALNELGRDSDRGRSIELPELLALVRAWAERRQAERAPPSGAGAVTPGARLHTACQAIGWSARATAERLGCDARTVQRWWADNPGSTPPESVVVWTEALAAHIAATPPPPAWKRR